MSCSKKLELCAEHAGNFTAKKNLYKNQNGLNNSFRRPFWSKNLNHCHLRSYAIQIGAKLTVARFAWSTATPFFRLRRVGNWSFGRVHIFRPPPVRLSGVFQLDGDFGDNLLHRLGAWISVTPAGHQLHQLGDRHAVRSCLPKRNEHFKFRSGEPYFVLLSRDEARRN